MIQNGGSTFHTNVRDNAKVNNLIGGQGNISIDKQENHF